MKLVPPSHDTEVLSQAGLDRADAAHARKRSELLFKNGSQKDVCLNAPNAARDQDEPGYIGMEYGS